MLSQQTPTNSIPLSTTSVAEAPSDHAPNLIVIGAMKASSTTFYELITRHPDVWFSSEKEPHYFTSPQYGEPTAWKNYLQLFEAAPVSAKFRGEASTGYSKLPHFGNTPLRLQETLDQPRFIYLVRDPVERTISNYQHSYLSGHYAAGTTLTEAVRKDPILIDASRYAFQIRAYWEVFGPQQLLILPTDQLHAEPARVMRRVESFLDLPAFDGWDAPLPQSNSKQALGRSLALQALLPKSLFGALRKLMPSLVREKLKNLAASTPNLPPVTDAERQLIFEKIADDLEDLRSILGEAISSWPSIQQLGEGS